MYGVGIVAVIDGGGTVRVGHNELGDIIPVVVKCLEIFMRRGRRHKQS